MHWLIIPPGDSLDGLATKAARYGLTGRLPRGWLLVPESEVGRAMAMVEAKALRRQRRRCGDMTRKERLRKLTLDATRDAARDFAYYRRKEDEDLSPEDLAEALASGAVTIGDIVVAFKRELKENL